MHVLQFPARALLVALGTVVLGVRSYVPATPTNSTQGWNPDDQGSLNVFWYPGGSLDDPLTLQGASVSLSDPMSVTGPIMHFADNAGFNVSSSSFVPWVALISCDTNSTDTSAANENVLARVQELKALVAILYSSSSKTCAFSPPASDPRSIAVYVIESPDYGTLEGFFNNINATRYGSFDSKTLKSQSSNISNWDSEPATDPGYLIVSVIQNSSVGLGKNLPNNHAVAFVPNSSPILLIYLGLGLGVLGWVL